MDSNYKQVPHFVITFLRPVIRTNEKQMLVEEQKQAVPGVDRETNRAVNRREE